MTITTAPGAAVAFDETSATVTTAHGPVTFAFDRDPFTGELWVSVEEFVTTVDKVAVMIGGHHRSPGVWHAASGRLVEHEGRVAKARAIVHDAYALLMANHAEQVHAVADTAMRQSAAEALATGRYLPSLSQESVVVSGLKGMAKTYRQRHRLTQIVAGVDPADITDPVVTVAMMIDLLGPVEL